MKAIELNKGAVAIVDDEDFERLAQWRWFINNDGYAMRNLSKKGYVFMHHEVIGRVCGKQTDHKNGNRLDNRRSNLRNATQSQNSRNTATRKDNKLGIKGVSIHRGRYRARIFNNGKRITLGRFKTPQEAKAAYDKAATDLFQEYARLN